MVSDQAYYDKGVKKSVYETHSWRSVSNAVDYIIPYLKPDTKLLDVGSGPGTITIDFANYITEGSIIGVEPTQELIDVSNANKDKVDFKVDHVSFQIGSIYKLPFEDNSFDIVHANQVTLHLEDPVAGLRELKRVCKPDGYVCVKDGDIKSTVMYPTKYEALVVGLVNARTEFSSTDPEAGRRLKEKALKAGYTNSRIKSTATCWCIADYDKKVLWRDMLINRLRNSGETFVSGGEEANKKKKEEAIKVLNEWVDDDAGWMNFMGGEIVYQKLASD